jgi:hypothetical protein
MLTRWTWPREHKITFAGVIVAVVAGVVIPLATTGSTSNVGNNSGTNNGIINNGTINFNGQDVPSPTGPSMCGELPNQLGLSNTVTFGLYARVSTGSLTCWTPELYPARTPERIEFLVVYENVSATLQRAVTVTIQLPPSLAGVPGSVTLINGNYPRGYKYDISNLNSTVAVDMGNYGPRTLAYVTFEAETASRGELACGKDAATVKAWVTPGGAGAAMSATAEVALFKDCP